VLKTIRLVLDSLQVEFTMDLDPCFVTDERLLQHLAHTAAYESEITWTMMRALRLGDTAIDVGANVGYFTLLMAALVGPEGKVTAFEPGPDNFPKLARNVDINGLGSRVVLDNRPVSDREDIVKFYFSQDDSGGHALWNPKYWPENVKTQAGAEWAAERQTTTLDAVAAQEKDIRLIKIDVEGAEHKVLEGAYRVLNWISPPFIIAEANWFGLEQMGSSLAAMRSLMGAHGYDTYLMHMEGKLPCMIPRKTELKIPHIYNVLFSTEDAISEAWTELKG
jgi:FkbM family methyltransferase